MQYRSLGRTGLRVSIIGLGTMVHAGHFGPMKDSESLSAIDAALELGVNFIDTSDAYGAGYSETLLGKTLRGRRDKVILATKGGNVMVGPDRESGNSIPPISAGCSRRVFNVFRLNTSISISCIIPPLMSLNMAKSGSSSIGPRKRARSVTTESQSIRWKRGSQRSELAAPTRSRWNIIS